VNVSLALVVKHVKPMRRVILSCALSDSIQYFSVLSHKRHDYRGKIFIEHNMRFLSLNRAF